LARRKTLQPKIYMYLVYWKEKLPAKKVDLTLQLEGRTSVQQGKCTLSAGRKSFWSTRFRLFSLRLYRLGAQRNSSWP
jgi:hypothetical protein